MRSPSILRRARRRFVQRKLVVRLWRFALIFLVLTGIVLYHLLTTPAPVLPALGMALLGFLLGRLISRTKKVRWQEETSLVVAKIDRFGGVVLVAYLAFALSRRWLLGHWFHGPALTVVVLSLTGGIMLGRLLFTRRRIIRVLKEQEKD